MRFVKFVLFICGALCAVCTNLASSRAQDTAVGADLPGFSSHTLVTDQSAADAAAKPLPSDTILPVEPILQETTKIQPAGQPMYGCACGCGIYEVGTQSMLPSGTGLTIYLQYAYQDQNQNWSGSHSAPAADNPDKEIRTHFLTPGLQYMLDRDWGIQVEIPVADRYFRTTGGASGNDIVGMDWTTIGDMRLEGIYTGLFDDQSLGFTFGAKLPTGNFTHNDAWDDIDRDSEIGTGSTDILLGGFYRHDLTSDGKLGWFAQVNLDLPVLFHDQYRAGIEVDSALGVYLNGLKLGPVGIIPIAQVLDGWRASDGEANAANPVASGYERVLLSPGIEFHIHPVMVYADVEVPVYAQVTGNQLVAPWLFKLVMSYKF